MSDNKEEIIFDDPEETELDELLDAETEKSHELDPIPEPQARWSPSGAGFRAEVIEDSPMYCVDGQMVDQLSAETVDADSMNFLLAKQREPLEPDPDGAVPVGNCCRAIDYSELEEAVGKVCQFCDEEITEEEASPRGMGSLVYYGLDERGQKKVWHWSCLGLFMLIICKGHPEKAAEVFHVDIRDLKALKTSYRSIPWGRLGWSRDGGKQ